MISKELGENLRNFSELLMTQNVAKEKYIGLFNNYIDLLAKKNEEEAVLDEIYKTEINEPRMNMKLEYDNYVQERQVIFDEYMRTKKKSALQRLLGLKNPLEKDITTNTMENSIYTKYGNPKNTEII